MNETTFGFWTQMKRARAERFYTYAASKNMRCTIDLNSTITRIGGSKLDISPGNIAVFIDLHRRSPFTGILGDIWYPMNDLSEFWASEDALEKQEKQKEQSVKQFDHVKVDGTTLRFEMTGSYALVEPGAWYLNRNGVPVLAIWGTHQQYPLLKLVESFDPKPKHPPIPEGYELFHSPGDAPQLRPKGYQIAGDANEWWAGPTGHVENTMMPDRFADQYYYIRPIVPEVPLIAEYLVQRTGDAYRYLLVTTDAHAAVGLDGDSLADCFGSFDAQGRKFKGFYSQQLGHSVALADVKEGDIARYVMEAK